MEVDKKWGEREGDGMTRSKGPLGGLEAGTTAARTTASVYKAPALVHSVSDTLPLGPICAASWSSEFQTGAQEGGQLLH